MKKSILLIVLGLFLIAGAVYASNAINTNGKKTDVGMELPDKDPNAKKTCDSKSKCNSESKEKSCCTGDKTSKKEGACCESAKTEDNPACCDKSKSKSCPEAPASGNTGSATPEKSNCTKTKCQ